MVILAFLALVALAVAVGCAVAALQYNQARRTEHLGQIESYGYVAGGAPETAKAPWRQGLDSLAASIGDSLSGRFTSLKEAEVQRRLIAAGFFGIGARRFTGYRVLIVVAAPILTIWLFSLLGTATGLLILLGIAAAIVGWVAPSYVLSRRARARLADIDFSMPELIDLLVVTLEAGVAFAPALRFAAERLDGPLGEEVRLTVQEQSLGLSMLDALENWYGRCDTPSVRGFVRAMIQGERLGVSVGQILRNLAVEMRARRQQIVEEKAQRAPVKIMFPLVFLIFPAMFVIILGPALYKISGSLGN